MNRVQSIITLLATAIAICAVTFFLHLWRENSRLRQNNYALTERVTHYRTRDSLSAISVGVLQMQVSQFRHQHRADMEHIRALGIRLRRAESYAATATESHYEGALPLRDSVVADTTDTLIVRDTVRIFGYDDGWSTLAGVLLRDTVRYTLRTVDTLRQVVHRVPRRWWFLRFGTKAIRQEILSSNPHTTLVYSEYIELSR